MSPIPTSFRPHRIAGPACAALLTSLSVAHANGVSDDKLIIHDTGRLIVNSELTVTGGDVLIKNGGVMEVNTGSTTTATNLEIQFGGLLTGCGTIIANVINDGMIVAECGPGTFLVIDGNLTIGATGTTEISSGTELQVSGDLVNNGLLDTRGGSLTAGGFTNNGTYLFDGSGFSTDIDLTFFGIVGNDFKVTASTLSGKSYVLEVSTTLEPNSWTLVGFPQSGTDGPLDFIHLGGGTATKAFYRIREVPNP